MAKRYDLVLDLGTTGVKAFIFDDTLGVVGQTYLRLGKKNPRADWVEQNPAELVRAAKQVLRRVIKEGNISAHAIRSMGIATQRETVIAWDKQTGRAICPAIVWQDARTKKDCATLEKYQDTVRQKTGLFIEPYFSATKMHWILQHVPRAAVLLKQGRLALGTPDSWLLWQLGAQRPHLTDYTNASRTLLFNMHTLQWDGELAAIFGIPLEVLPKAYPSRSLFGRLDKSVLGVTIPIRAVVGDQQASMVGAGEQKGATKVTYGTGTFIMQSLGSNFSLHSQWFTTLLASSIPGKPKFAFEAKIDFGAHEIDAVLAQPKKFERVLTQLSKRVAAKLKSLPLRPQVLVIDGGITQSPSLATLQAKASRARIIHQKIYNGTALGVAKLLR